jgi:hypothetical protein
VKRRLLFLTVLAAAALGTWFYASHTRPTAPAAPPPRAFLNAVWGMGPEEIARVNQTPLEPPVSGRRFYVPPAGSEARYRTLETRQHKFFGRPSIVSYTFVDDKLFAYHVFVSDEEEETLDKNMREYLADKFGPSGTAVEDGTRLKMVWQKGDVTVNYWFYEEEMGLTGRYKAVLGVLYRPLERSTAN